MPAKPPKLRKGDKSNFETLRQAADNGDLALVSSIRKSDGKPVSLVCAVNRPDGPEGEYVLVPLAVMIEGNPYDDFIPP